MRVRYGCPTIETYDLFAYVRKSICTDEQLMQQIIEDVYLPLYPNYHKVVKRDNNGKLLSGPIFLKTDSGQGRLVARFSILGFHERMQDTGVYIVLVLPNSTSSTQDLDKLYQEFKGKTISKTREISSKKLADRSLLIKTYKDELTTLGFHGNWNIITDLTQDDCDRDEAIVVLEYCVVTPDMQVVLDKLIKAMISPSLSNDDLPQIANGMKNEPITSSPFFSTSTKDKIINCF